MFTVTYTFGRDPQRHIKTGTWSDLTHFIGYVLVGATVQRLCHLDGRDASELEVKFNNDAVLARMKRK